MKQNREHKFQIRLLTACLVVSMCANVYAFLIMPKAADTDSVVVQKLDPAYFEGERIAEYMIPEETPAVNIVLTPTPQETKKTVQASQKTALPSLQYEGATVYVTKSGKKFHRDGCGSLSKSKIAMLYEEAAVDGYTPCGKCKP